MYDLYEIKNHCWMVVDTFQSLDEAIQYFEADTILQVSDDVYTINAGDDITMLRILIRCKAV